MDTRLAVLIVILLAPPLGAEEPIEPVANAVGLDGVEAGRISFADLDGDGYPDIIAGCRKIFLNRAAEKGAKAARMFVRSPHDGFLEKAHAERRITSVQVGDVNNDGIADLFLGRSLDMGKGGEKGPTSEIWLGSESGKYERVKEAGVEARDATISASFVDYDRDGILDLFTANSYVMYGKSLEAGPDRLFRGKGDGAFEDVTKKAGLLGVAAPARADSRRPSYGCAHTDWNNDGLQDLLTMSYGRQWNRLWRQNGDGTFTDVGPKTNFDGDADESGTYPEWMKKQYGRQDEAPFRSNGNTFDAAVADFDNDGDMDVFLSEITHFWAGPSSDRSMLLVNLGEEEGYAFDRQPQRIPPRKHPQRWNQGDLHAGWMDVDHDGRLDLLIASSDYPDNQILRLYHQEADGSFSNWTDRLGFRWRNASQLSLGDFDGDGATDLLLATNRMRLTKEQRKEHSLELGLFRNVLPENLGHSYLTLHLIGKGKGHSNRDAVGARVTIHIDEDQQTREVYGGLGHAGHRDEATLRFGVGEAAVIDRIEVRWPDSEGTVQTFNEVKPNASYRLVEGGKLEEGR